jgi:hypothetical protein
MDHAEGERIVDVIANVGVEDQVDRRLDGHHRSAKTGGKKRRKHHGGSRQADTTEHAESSRQNEIECGTIMPEEQLE